MLGELCGLSRIHANSTVKQRVSMNGHPTVRVADEDRRRQWCPVQNHCDVT